MHSFADSIRLRVLDSGRDVLDSIYRENPYKIGANKFAAIVVHAVLWFRIPSKSRVLKYHANMGMGLVFNAGYLNYVGDRINACKCTELHFLTVY